MRPRRAFILRDTVASLEASPNGEVWLDHDDFAGLVQRLQGEPLCLPYEWTKGVLRLGVLILGGHGVVRRYENTWGKRALTARETTVVERLASVDVSRLALAEGSPE